MSQWQQSSGNSSSGIGQAFSSIWGLLTAVIMLSFGASIALGMVTRVSPRQGNFFNVIDQGQAWGANGSHFLDNMFRIFANDRLQEGFDTRTGEAPTLPEVTEPRATFPDSIIPIGDRTQQKLEITGSAISGLTADDLGCNGLDTNCDGFISMQEMGQ